MFDELIASRKLVKIYYNNDQHCLFGTITNYYAEHEIIKIDTQNIMLPIRCIDKVEIYEHDETHGIFKHHETLRSDVDLDNAMFLSIPITKWRNGELLANGTLIDEHTERYVVSDSVQYNKYECIFKVSSTLRQNSYD